MKITNTPPVQMIQHGSWIRDVFEKTFVVLGRPVAYSCSSGGGLLLLVVFFGSIGLLLHVLIVDVEGFLNLRLQSGIVIDAA